jgi:type I restriction enzyme S subunit
MSVNPAEPRPRYKPYRQYKDSGVEWLGEIPAHWEPAPVYARYEVALGKMLDAKQVTGTHTGRYLRNVDVQWDRVNVEELPEMDFDPSERPRFRLRAGDLLVCEGGEVGRTAIWRGELQECFYQKAIHRVRPRTPQEHPRFFYYLMYSLAARGLFVAEGNPNTIDHLTAVHLKHYRFPFAPSSEQEIISAFLDRETARIDGLVAKKERLIELLQEKRSALITRAVTKGLDPNVPMKDSGVEWLGEIPARWECLALAHVTVSRCDGPFGSGLKSEHYADAGARVVRLQNIGWAEFSGSDQAYIDEAYATALGDHRVLAGDLLIAGLGDEGHPVGRACVAPEGIEPAMVKADCFRFRLDQRRVLARFAAYQLSATASATAGTLATGATRSRMNLTTMAARKIVLPPLPQQRAIVDLLEREEGKYQALVGNVRTAIDRLRELRTALISAAVTGKIDVRQESP